MIGMCHHTQLVDSDFYCTLGCTNYETSPDWCPELEVPGWSCRYRPLLEPGSARTILDKQVSTITCFQDWWWLHHSWGPSSCPGALWGKHWWLLWICSRELLPSLVRRRGHQEAGSCPYLNPSSSLASLGRSLHQASLSLPICCVVAGSMDHLEAKFLDLIGSFLF